MALNLTNVFTMLGRAGRNAYIINGAQDTQDTPFNQTAALAFVNPAWIAPLSQSYDAGIRSETGSMSSWTTFAATCLQQMVADDSPAYGTSLGAALAYLEAQMRAQSATVLQCTVGGSSAAEAGNLGSGSVFITLIRGDGLSLQNTIAEVGTVLITADSYTGGQTAGREPWQWVGSPNVSSLNTGVGVGLWDWDWPQGSGSSAAGVCVSASQDASTGVGNNYLTNGDMEDWDTTGTPFLNYWDLGVGTWGTSIQQESGTVLGGTYSVRFNAGATLNELTQQFDSADLTGATAGTTAALEAFTGYAFNMWLRASGVISGGVMTVSLVDSGGTVINDQQGTANSQTVTLSTIGSGSWTGVPFAFRTPVVLPSDGIVRLKIKITTALAGANLYMDEVCFTQPTNLYLGGPSIALFSNPADPYEAGPDPDGYTLTFTNNRGGASFGATFQTLVNRLFQTPELILPYDPAPTILDTLITAP